MSEVLSDAATGAATAEPVVAAPAASAGGRTLASAAVYTVCSALGRAIGFLMLPVYTRALGRAQYGTLGLVSSIAAVAGIAMALGLDLAIFRTYFQLAGDPDRRDAFVGSVWRVLIAFPAAVAVVGGGIAWVVVGKGGLLDGADLFLALAVAATLVAGATVPLAILRAEQRLRDFAVCSVATALTNVALTLVFVLVFDWGVHGWLLANVAGNLAGLVVAMVVMPWRPGIRIDGALVRRSVLFGLPLVPHYLSQWALTLADRAVLAGLVSAASLGVYSFGGNLALPAMIGVQSLNQAFMPSYARAGAGAGGAAASRELSPLVVLQVRLVVVLTAAVALLGVPLVHVMAPGSFAHAAAVVPWVVLGYGLLGLYYLPMNAATLVAGRSRMAWVATAISAVANIVLVLVLTPAWGIRGTAIASALGYAVLLAGIGIYAHRAKAPMDWPWGRLLGAIALGVAVYAAAVLTSPAEGAAGLALRLAWCAVLTAALLRREGAALLARLRPSSRGGA